MWSARPSMKSRLNEIQILKYIMEIEYILTPKTETQNSKNISKQITKFELKPIDLGFVTD